MTQEVKNRAHRPGWPLTKTMHSVLRLAAKGLSLYTCCTIRAEHGSRSGLVLALRGCGLLVENVLTDAGLASISKAERGA